MKINIVKTRRKEGWRREEGDTEQEMADAGDEKEGRILKV